MARVMLVVALVIGMQGGCNKKKDSDEGQYSGGGNPTVYGAQQAVRKSVESVVTAAEMHDLFLLMNYAKGASGRVPTSQETWELLNKPDGNPKLRKMIQDGLIVLVPNPGEEGLWAYEKEAPNRGGWVLTHIGESRMLAADFNRLKQGN